MSDYRDIYNVKRDIYKHNAQYGTAYIIGLFIEEMAECDIELSEREKESLEKAKL